MGADWSTALRVCFIVRMSSAWVRARIWANQGVRVRFTVRVGVRVRVEVRVEVRVGVRVRVKVTVRVGEEGCHREHARELGVVDQACVGLRLGFGFGFGFGLGSG